MYLRDVDLLAVILQTPKCLTPICWGEPGAGKTAKIQALSRAMGWHLETVIASIREPSDFGGLPVPENGHGVRLEPPSWAVRVANHAGPAVVFLDEASCATPAVQSALLRPILEGWVGDLHLPSTVRWVAAANPPDQAAGGWDLAPPLANRFIHLKWASPTAEEWREWLFNGDAREGSFPVIDPNGWENQFSQAKALVAGFLRTRPGSMSEPADRVLGRFPPAFATCRTWEAAARLMASCRFLRADESLLLLMTACLGEPISLELCSWVRDNDLPDPEELLADPKKWVPDERYPDRVFATCLAVGAAAVQPRINGKDFSKSTRRERWHQGWRVLGRAMDMGKDLVTIPGNTLCRKDNRPEGGLLDADVRKIIVQLADVVEAAGL